MQTRTCPVCGYKYSRNQYLKKLFFKFSWSKWTCLKCKSEITFDINRRVNVAICFTLYFFALFLVTRIIEMSILTWLIYGTMLLAGSFFIFSYDTFKKA